MRWSWPFRRKQRDVGSDAVMAKNEAERKLEVTRAQRPQVEALGERLHEQLHRRNQIGKLFDDAFRGAK